MLAPVYRHRDIRGDLLGLTVVEWGLILLVFRIGMVGDRPNVGLVAACALYAGISTATRERPEGFMQHLVLWHLRQQFAGGRFSAAARARAPRFPFAPYAPSAGCIAPPPGRTPNRARAPEYVPLWVTRHERSVTALVTPAGD